MAKKTALKNLIWHKPPMQNGLQNPSIFRITVRENETQVDMGYSAYNIYINGGWIRINAHSYLLDIISGLKYKMTKAVGIPIAPEKLEFKTKTDWQYFSLLFEPLPKQNLLINLIEPNNLVNSDHGDNFAFFRIELNLEEALEEY